MSTPGFTIFAVSDATGELAHMLTKAALGQFQNHDVAIVRASKVKDTSQLAEFVNQAKACHGVIVFTMVKAEMRREMLSLCQKAEVVAVDVLGPTLDALANYLHDLPSPEPGLQYRLTREYFQRTEAVEFTVKHDDGLNAATLADADVVLLGVSRTSKTPLSIFLAYHGFRCANVPIVKGLPIPKTVQGLDRKKMVGLTISPQKLENIRSTRLKKLGRPDSEDYAQLAHIREELDYAQNLFRELGILNIDVTGKAIEEVAGDIINTLKL